MKPFTHGKWHAWQGTAGIMLSDEDTKTLRGFTSADQTIHWLWASGDKEAARALNKHIKETT